MVYFDDERHLVADTKKELSEFMLVAGIKKCWRHNWTGKRPHCDIPKKLNPSPLVTYWFAGNLTAHRVTKREVLALSKRMA